MLSNKLDCIDQIYKCNPNVKSESTVNFGPRFVLIIIAYLEISQKTRPWIKVDYLSSLYSVCQEKNKMK